MTILSELTSEASITIDASGQPCPLPLLKLKQGLRTMAQGEKILLIASDPHSQHDIARFCTIAGQQMHRSEHIDTFFYFLIEKSG